MLFAQRKGEKECRKICRGLSFFICSRIIASGLTKQFQRYLIVNNVNNIDKKREIYTGKVSSVPVFYTVPYTSADRNVERIISQFCKRYMALFYVIDGVENSLHY